jgi:hypothetical protein
MTEAMRRQTPSARPMVLCVDDEPSGMTLADDARSRRDGLVIARGQRVTERLVERLANLGENRVREPLRVYDTPGDGDV